MRWVFLTSGQTLILRASAWAFSREPQAIFENLEQYPSACAWRAAAVGREGSGFAFIALSWISARAGRFGLFHNPAMLSPYA